MIEETSIWDGLSGKYLHKIHCREDRCVYGCSCPCHRNVNMNLTRREKMTVWLKGIRRKFR